MKKKKVYSSELKLQLVKEYLNSEKSLKEFSDEYSIPNDPTFYFKSLGDKKLSVVFKDQH